MLFALHYYEWITGYGYIIILHSSAKQTHQTILFGVACLGEGKINVPKCG